MRFFVACFYSCVKLLQHAERLYDPILERAGRAQRNYNAKRFLNENSFLFDLPRK
jgi:hypothetical protein